MKQTLKRDLNLKILHLSDLHFGKINPEVVKNLTSFINKAQDLDLIILTGDLTQRAKSYQFQAAAEFIKSFSVPVVAVPGNHDMPLYNLLGRFFKTFRKYNKIIAPHIKDIFENEDLVVCGINTTNRYTVKDGHLSGKELEKLKTIFKDKNKFKIIACHHSLHIEKNYQRLTDLIETTHPHMILYGHDHQSGVYFMPNKENKFPFLVAAGTGTSTRTRKEANSFNFIILKENKITIETLAYNDHTFEISTTKEFPDIFLK